MQINIKPIDFFPRRFALANRIEQDHLHTNSQHILELSLGPSRRRSPDQAPNRFAQRVLAGKENTVMAEQPEAIVATGIVARVVPTIMVGWVAPGSYPPGAPTDPDVRNSRIRLLGLTLR